MKINQALLETITRIKVNMLQKNSNNLKSIMVTSANHGEGTSTLASNLALSLAIEKKNRVLLIDANIRKANLHVWFDEKQENGFTDFLKGEIGLGEIIKETSFTNIKLITAGKISHKGDYLDILSNITRDTQKELEKDFDWVIYDSSPVNYYPDTLLMTPLSDGIILVIFAERTRRAEVQKAKETLESINGNILGGVLNGRRHVIPQFIYNRL
jgi:capsular exopolysaccharide synthesis family protein